MNNNIEQLNKIIKEKRENRKERIKADIELYGREVLESEEMKQAYDQTHHLWSTVAEHTLRVTASSVLICYVLRKLHINVNIPAVVIAALCHDLGMLDRSEKFSSDKEARRDHAEESVKVAHEILDDMPEMADRGDHTALMADTAEKLYYDEYLKKRRKYFSLIARVTKTKR